VRDSSAKGKELIAAVDSRRISGAVVIGEVPGVTRHPDRRVTSLVKYTYPGELPALSLDDWC
jgi:hypothetical protein